MVTRERGVNLLDLVRDLRDALRSAFEIRLAALLFDFQNHDARIGRPESAERTQ